MSNPFAFTFPGGRLIDNFATLGAVATVSFTVPAGKRWMFLYGYAERDTSATLVVAIYNSADNLVWLGDASSAATTDCGIILGHSTISRYPTGLAGPAILKAGMYIKYTWGVAQNTPEVACVVLEMDA